MGDDLREKQGITSAVEEEDVKLMENSIKNDIKEDEDRRLREGDGEGGQVFDLNEISSKGRGMVTLPNRKGITAISFSDPQGDTITTLNLNGNPVERVVQGLEKLKSVKLLDCGDCGLNFIPRWIGELIAMEEIDLSHNNLEEFPAWLD